MSLKEELLKLSERIDDAIPDANQPNCRVKLRVIAAELRGMAKAMPDVSEIRGMSAGVVDTSVGFDPAAEDLKIKARMQKLEAKRQAAREEQLGERIIRVVGGPYDDTTLCVQSDPPDNAFTAIGGVRYQYREGAFHYAPYKDEPQK